MSSEAPKMGGGSMGRPGMDEKWRNPTTHYGGGRRVRQPDLGASGGGLP